LKLTHAVKNGDKISLDSVPTRADGGYSKEDGLAKLNALGRELEELQELMFAAGQHALLVVLQGRDTAGKDGAIRSLLRYDNVQSSRVVSFKVPNEKELAHDFLWRVHADAPAKGGMTIFNRSHYEDVLVAKVHELAPTEVIERRYDHINAFESLLWDSGTIIVKYFLHISKNEQEERLLAREEDPRKSWKLSVGDWREREFWEDYTHAYELALEKCSPKWAPWHIVSADRKWYRDLSIMHTLVETLRPHGKGWLDTLEKLGKREVAELKAFRANEQKG
jgi:PPK2 family polyphosphate:nucleotide phosphotransferase